MPNLKGKWIIVLFLVMCLFAKIVYFTPLEPYFYDQLYGTYGFQLDDEVYYIVFPKDETKFYFYDLNKRIFVSGSIIEFENNAFQLDSSQNADDIIENQRINYNQQCINIRVYGEAKEFKKISNASYRADSVYTQYSTEK